MYETGANSKRSLKEESYKIFVLTQNVSWREMTETFYRCFLLSTCANTSDSQVIDYYVLNMNLY